MQLVHKPHTQLPAASWTGSSTAFGGTALARRRGRRHQLEARALAAGSPGQQFMAQLNSVSPVELEPETVVLSFMAVFPFALYAAGRVLLWNPETQSSMPERSEVTERGHLPSGSGSAYQWTSQPAARKPRQSRRSRQAAWAAEFVTRSVRLTSAMARHSAARECCAAPVSWPASWLWLSFLLQLQDAQQQRVRRSAIMGDLAEATMRVSIPLALSEARRLSPEPQE